MDLKISKSKTTSKHHHHKTKRRRGAHHTNQGDILRLFRERICTEPGCEAPVLAKHLCKTCYERAQRVKRAGSLCTKTDCPKGRYRQTLCWAHYRDFCMTKKTVSKRKCCVETCDYLVTDTKTRYCSMHDSVYGEGVSKNIRDHISQEEILKTVQMTKLLLEQHPELRLDAGLD